MSDSTRQRVMTLGKVRGVSEYFTKWVEAEYTLTQFREISFVTPQGRNLGTQGEALEPFQEVTRVWLDVSCRPPRVIF